MSEKDQQHQSANLFGDDFPGLVGPALTNEIRGPLTNIILSLDLLELENAADDPQVYLDIIRRNVMRVEAMISGVSK